jgi:hypothetical protein
MLPAGKAFSKSRHYGLANSKSKILEFGNLCVEIEMTKQRGFEDEAEGTGKRNSALFSRLSAQEVVNQQKARLFFQCQANGLSFAGTQMDWLSPIVAGFLIESSPAARRPKNGQQRVIAGEEVQSEQRRE